MMSPDDFQLRYARQIALADWGVETQQRLQRKSVFILGLGGLGSPVATYLAAAGVGKLVLNDFDHVDLSNLSRQPLHTTRDIRKLKTQSACEALQDLNPGVQLQAINSRMTLQELTAAFADVDCVIDCSDNFGTRFSVNQATVNSRKPLLSVAAIRYEGQMILLRNDLDSRPCYRCLYDETQDSAEDCQGQGVISPLVGVMGTLAATAALNFLTKAVDTDNFLHCFDATTLTLRKIKLKPDPACPVCAGA